MLLLPALILRLSAPAHALEGMWEPSQLADHAADLARLGWTGDPATLGRLDVAPLGAVASLDGCTASWVSTDGLLVTNHHCVIDYLSQAQKEGQNLIKTGFYAPTRAEELPGGDAARVYITTKVEDVTAAVLGRMPVTTDDVGRQQLIEDREKALIQACERTNANSRCDVHPFFEGQRYTLITRLELRDLRVVMAPPDMVGNYGDEVDNWHWPRHAGDFGFLRAYVGKDGKPADYSPDNVPYHPPLTMKIQPAGIEPGQFVMVAGYPWSTTRWLTSGEVARAATVELPKEIERFRWLMDEYARQIQADPKAEAPLTIPVNWTGNDLFADVGVVEAFARGGVVDAAKQRDAALTAWVQADPARKAKYGRALQDLASVVARRDAWSQRDEVIGTLERSDLVDAAARLYRLAQEREKPDAKRALGFQERDVDGIRDDLSSMQASLWLPLERAYLTKILLEAVTLPPDQQVASVTRWVGGTDAAAVDKAVARLFDHPALATTEGRLALVGVPAKQIEASTDGFLSLAVALAPYDAARRAEELEDGGALARLRPLYVEAFRAFDPARAYSDANQTLRITYGTVQGYAPRDGVIYTPQTTLEGVAAKAGPWPFDAPAPLLDAIRSGKRGPYVDPALGTVPVDFLSDLDITGGNSGSPTLNAKGELVGLAFDGNYEGIASDYAFDPKVARTIHVDIRYVLYYLDAVVHAKPLLQELGVQPAF